MTTALTSLGQSQVDCAQTAVEIVGTHENVSWDGQWTYRMEPEVAQVISRWADETSQP
jgi:hypothetical protein